MTNLLNFVGGVAAPYHYRLYGTEVLSQLPLTSAVPRGGGPGELTFTLGNSPPACIQRTGRSTVAPELRDEKGQLFGYVEELPGVDVLRLGSFFDFYIWPKKIHCHLHAPEHRDRVEVFLLATAMAYWHERNGRPSLHASAVEVDGGAVAFLANNKGGKTTLALEFLRAGYSLVTDDILVLERISEGFRARSGYPQLRLWPDQAERLLGSVDGLQPVHSGVDKLRLRLGADVPGEFSSRKEIPIRCIYLPERTVSREEGHHIEIAPLLPREALAQLFEKSFLPGIVATPEMQPRRFQDFAELIRRVPIRRMRYPTGIAHLSEVRTAILKDIDELQAGLRVPA